VVDLLRPPFETTTQGHNPSSVIYKKQKTADILINVLPKYFVAVFSNEK